MPIIVAEFYDERTGRFITKQVIPAKSTIFPLKAWQWLVLLIVFPPAAWIMLLRMA